MQGLSHLLADYVYVSGCVLRLATYEHRRHLAELTHEVHTGPKRQLLLTPVWRLTSLPRAAAMVGLQLQQLLDAASRVTRVSELQWIVLLFVT